MSFSSDKGVEKEYAQWRHPEMESRLDTQARIVLPGSVSADGVREVTSARGAEKRNRILGKEPGGRGAKLHKDLVSDAKERELGGRKQPTERRLRILVGC